MNSSKYLPKLISSYLNRLNFSTKIGTRCLCHSLHNQRSLVKVVRLKTSRKDNFYRHYSADKGSFDDDKDESNSSTIVGAGLGNYKMFQDQDSPLILDIDEERNLMLENPELLEEVEKENENQFFGLNVDRGVNGVFEVEDLVTVLKNDNALNVVVIAIPPEYRYVDYMVIVSGRSFKHLYAMTEFVKKLYKKKKHASDLFPKVEGLNQLQTSPEWLAMDLGNIALHLFLEPARVKYDLETLWSVGKEYDDLYNKKDEDYVSLLQQHTVANLDNLIPLDHSFDEEEQKELA